MKEDITERADIEKLILAFYEKVRGDDTIGIIFNEVMEMDWPHHIPVIVNFWDSMLLNADNYHANAMVPHFAINQKFQLHKQHFDKWVQLFCETVNDFFEGPVASLAITRAKSIAGIMQIKMDSINSNR